MNCLKIELIVVGTKIFFQHTIWRMMLLLLASLETIWEVYNIPNVQVITKSISLSPAVQQQLITHAKSHRQ